MKTPDPLIKQLRDHVEEMGLFRCPIEITPPLVKPYIHYGYENAQKYIERQLSTYGVSYTRQPVIDEGKTFFNIVTKVENDLPKLLFTAHYDTAFFCGGADDNGSSVAVILELIRELEHLELPIQFVFFTLEEGNLEFLRYQRDAWIHYIIEMEKKSGKLSENFRPLDLPFKETDIWQHALVGSRTYVNNNSATMKSIKGVINLESVGYYSADLGSQKNTFSGSLPSTANFLAILCNNQSIALTELLTISASEYNFPFYPLQEEKYPEESIFLRADHFPFWRTNVPAVTLTDTLEARYKFYHMPLDLPHELDYNFMAKLVIILSFFVQKMLKSN